MEPMASTGQNRDGRPSGSDWSAWLADSIIHASANRPGGSGGNPHVSSEQLRVSDAERSKVAETLSRHFGDGRLDHAELEERLQAAMSAKTRGDLAPLLADLPDDPPAPAPAQAVRLPRRPFGDSMLRAAAGLLLVVIILLVLVPGGAFHAGGFIFLAFVLLFLARRAMRRQRRATRAWHAHLHQHGTPHWHGPQGPVIGAGPNPPGGSYDL